MDNATEIDKSIELGSVRRITSFLMSDLQEETIQKIITFKGKLSWMFLLDTDLFKLVVSRYTMDTIPWKLVYESWLREPSKKSEEVEKIIKSSYVFLDSNDSISNLIDYIRSKNVSKYVVYPVKHCNYMLMLRYGFEPVYRPDAVKTVEFMRYMKASNEERSSGVFVDALSFWSEIDISKYLELLQSCPVWKWRSSDQHIVRSEQTSSSFPLAYIAPHLLYSSGRPKTSMMTFYSPNNNRISRHDISLVESKDRYNIYSVTIKGEIFHAIPVTRYVKGMSKGLYYGKRTPEICGVFYYYEPESSTLLLYRPEYIVTFFNKTEAFSKLGVIDIEYADENQDEILKMHISGVIPPDMILPPDYARGLLGIENEVKDKTPQYAGVKLSLYGYEDQYDQELCAQARGFETDIVILTNMIGSFQVVCEVLDTRDIKDSYASLAYIID